MVVEASTQHQKRRQPRLAHSLTPLRCPAKNNVTVMDPFRGRGVRKSRQKGESNMLQKVTTVVILGIALAVAACNTVRGAARDVNSVANCTENTMNGNGCH